MQLNLGEFLTLSFPTKLLISNVVKHITLLQEITATHLFHDFEVKLQVFEVKLRNLSKILYFESL